MGGKATSIRLMLVGALGLAATTTRAAFAGQSVCPPNKQPPPYPPGRCHLTVSSTTIAAGGQVQVSGSGFAAHTNISFTLNPGPAIGTLLTDGSGTVTGSVTIPSHTAPGSGYVIKATGSDPNGFGYGLWSDPITVTKAGMALSATGAVHRRPLTTARPLGLVALLLLVALGSGAAVSSRRRDSNRSNAI